MSDTTAPEQASPPGQPLARVLVVDPTEMGGLLQMLLQRHRIDAHLCRTAGAALDAILAAPPALAIIDLDLPDASGVDLLHILRQPPENVPVVFTGSAPKEALSQNVQRGVEAAQGFFQKPLHAKLLLDHVTQLLGLSRLPTVTPPSGVPIPAAEDLGQMPRSEDPFTAPRAGMGPDSLPVPSMAPMEGVQPFLSAAGEEEALGVEHLDILDEDVVLVESDLPAAAAPATPPPLPEDAWRQSSPSMPTLPPMPEGAPLDDGLPPSLEGGPTLTDLRPPMFSAPPPLPRAAPPPESQPDPTDLMAMWMRKRAAAVSSPRLPTLVATPPPVGGTLLETPLHSLLDAFYSAQESGSIVLVRGAAQRKVGMMRGVVGPCQSNVLGEQAVAVLESMKLLPPDVLAQARAASAGKDVLGRLVADGVLTRTTALQVLEEQRARILKAAFAARDATYTLAFGPPPRTTLAPLHVGAVTVRGLLGSFTLLELREKLPRSRIYIPRTDGHFPLEALALTGEQARLVIACDGTKTVEDLLTVSDLAEHEALGMLHALEALRLVKPVAAAPHRTRGPTFF